MSIRTGWTPVYLPWLCGLWIYMSLLGCSTLHHRKHRNTDTNPLATVRLIHTNGSEHIEAIPSKGLLLCDLLSGNRIQSPAMEPATQSVRGSAATLNSNALDSLSKTLNTALEDSEYDLQDPQVSQLVESMSARLQLADAKDPGDKDPGAKDRARQIVVDYAQSLKTEGIYQPFTDYIKKAEPAELSTLTQVPYGPSPIHRDALEGRLVCITRAKGEQIILPVSQLERSPLGGILLADGDTISIHSSEDFTVPSAASSPRVVVTGMAQEAGQAIEMPSNSRLTQLYQQQAGPYADVAVLTRVNPVGKLRHHIIPLDSTGVIHYDIDLQDGDLIYLSNLELLPIVVASKAASREMQLKSLEGNAPAGLLRKRGVASKGR